MLFSNRYSTQEADIGRNPIVNTENEVGGGYRARLCGLKPTCQFYTPDAPPPMAYDQLDFTLLQKELKTFVSLIHEFLVLPLKVSSVLNFQRNMKVYKRYYSYF